MPNEIFLLGLSSGALAVYAYLLCCENRETYPCWPGCRTIGSAVKMSANTVRKYVCELEERQLINAESTTVTTRDGLKRNGNLLYTIRPIQLALNQFYEQQLAQMDVAVERQQLRKHPFSAVISAAQRDDLCAAVWPFCYPEGNKPPLTTDAAVSKACGRCAPFSEFSTSESGR